MRKRLVLSLCDFTGNMVRPWIEAGYSCVCVDLQHEETRTLKTSVGAATISYVRADVRTYLPPLAEYVFVAAFPPCTNLANSGARWFKEKGLLGLAQGLEVVDACRRICEWAGAPYCIENPTGTLSTYWRKPDHTFDPCDYGDPYTKRTCLWVGNGFVMPPKAPVEPVTPNPIHWAKPGTDRGNRRSVTPMGFARAVFEANGRTLVGRK